LARLQAGEIAQESPEPLVETELHLGLFTPGGPFENYPGPILVVGQNCVVLAANAAADPLVALLQAGGPAELREAIEAAFNGKTAQINPLRLESPNGGRVTPAYDLTALPWGDAPAVLLIARDITLERSLRAALIESRQRYKDLVEIGCDFAWETDAGGRFTLVTEDNVLGYVAAELVGETALDFLVGEEDVASSPFSTRRPIKGSEIWFRRRDDTPACLSVTALPMTDANGQWCGVRGQCRDISEEYEHQSALARARNRERLFAHILRVVRDELAPRRMLTAAAEELVPALSSSGVAIYRKLDDGEPKLTAQAGIAPPDTLIRGLLEQVIAFGEDEQRSLESGSITVRATRHRGAHNGALCVWRDTKTQPWNEDEQFLLQEISIQIAAAHQQLAREEELKRLSSTDPLTGLLNRRSFVERLERRFGSSQSADRCAALFYIDMDNFKRVNDRFGHQRGDMVLVRVAELLCRRVRDSDLVARLGGDEFGILVEDVSAAMAMEKAEALLQAMAELRGESADEDHPLGLSIGIAVFDPRHDETLDSLMSRADDAMYAAKRRGKGGLQIAEPPVGD